MKTDLLAINKFLSLCTDTIIEQLLYSVDLDNITIRLVVKRNVTVYSTKTFYIVEVLNEDGELKYSVKYKDIHLLIAIEEFNRNIKHYSSYLNHLTN